MATIGYEDIVDVLLNISDPNTWAAVSEVPWVSSPKINAGVSVYNVEEWWEWVAWWNTDITWSAWTWSISWSSWNLNLPNWTQVPISSGSTSVSTYTYIYVDTTTWTVNTTTSALNAVWENKIMLCVAFPNSWKNVTYKAFGSPYQNSLTTGSDIASWTITTGLIQAGAITTNLIATDAVTANEIASNSISATHIKSWAVTAGKIDVNQLSAISANLWSITAWDITWTTITAWNTSSTAIKLNPNNNRIEFYYNWSMVGYMAWWSVDGNWWILINADFAGMAGRDTFDLYNGMLRIPVWNNLYN